jgi:hypothetical protein
MVLEEDCAQDFVKDLGAKMVQSLLKGDVSALAELLDEGFVLRLQDGERISKDEWLGLIATCQMRYSSLSVELGAVHIYDGQVAFLSGHTVSDKTVRGRRVAGRFPYTALYVCRYGNWKVVAIHQIGEARRNSASASSSTEAASFWP